jgi:predicted phage terminase large subunit-like protein
VTKIKQSEIIGYLSKCSIEELRRISHNITDPRALVDIHKLIEEREHRKVRLNAKQDFLSFVKYNNKKYQEGWANRIIAQELQELMHPDSDVDRLIIQCPPRIGKTLLASVNFPAFLFGHDPTMNIISTSYASDLAQRINRDVQRLIDTDTYREIFPDTLLSGSNVRVSSLGSYIRTSDMFEIVKYKGAYRSAGVGGSITGQGADYLFIDDPVKDWAEAISKTTQQKIWDWYTSTAYTRLSPTGKVVIIMTRWNEYDLVGRLLKAQKEENADKWKVVSLPMEYSLSDEFTHELDPRTEEGELLWPERFNTKYVNRRKFSIPPVIYNALYQQNPVISGGNIFKRADFDFYSVLPVFESMFLSLDAAFKDTAKSDFVAFGIWGIKDKRYYLVEAYKERLSFNNTLRILAQYILKYPKLNELIIEAKANGDAIINTLEEAPELTIPIFSFSPTDSKEARAWAVTPQFSAKKVLLPDMHLERNLPNLFVEDYIKEMIAFPKGENDDYVDMTTQFLIRTQDLHASWVEDMLNSPEFKTEESSSHILSIMGFTKNRGSFGIRC